MPQSFDLEEVEVSMEINKMLMMLSTVGAGYHNATMFSMQMGVI